MEKSKNLAVIYIHLTWLWSGDGDRRRFLIELLLSSLTWFQSTIDRTILLAYFYSLHTELKKNITKNRRTEVNKQITRDTKINVIVVPIF